MSHALRRLEDSAGAPLLQSNSRRFGLTEQGRLLHQACERIFRDLEETEQAMSRENREIRERLVLGAPVEFGTTVLMRKMRGLLDRHPELHLDFHFAHDLVQPLLQDEVDLVVDCRLHPHPSLVSLALFRETWAAIASPELLGRQSLAVPRDLERVAVLSTDREARWWNNLLQALPPEERPLLGRVMVIDHIRGIINAALDGLGVGFVPRYTVLREIESGELVALFPGLQLLEDQFRIYQKRARAGRPAHRVVTEYLQGLEAGEFGDIFARA